MGKSLRQVEQTFLWSLLIKNHTIIGFSVRLKEKEGYFLMVAKECPQVNIANK